jgi:hypothetical protein
VFARQTLRKHFVLPRFELCAIGIDLEQSLYALDSTTIDLCLSLFPWARFRKHKGAVKMHALLDLHGSLDNCMPEKSPFRQVPETSDMEIRAFDDLPTTPGESRTI